MILYGVVGGIWQEPTLFGSSGSGVGWQRKRGLCSLRSPVPLPRFHDLLGLLQLPVGGQKDMIALFCCCVGGAVRIRGCTTCTTARSCLGSLPYLHGGGHLVFILYRVQRSVFEKLETKRTVGRQPINRQARPSFGKVGASRPGLPPVGEVCQSQWRGRRTSWCVTLLTPPGIEEHQSCITSRGWGSARDLQGTGAGPPGGLRSARAGPRYKLLFSSLALPILGVRVGSHSSLLHHSRSTNPKYIHSFYHPGYKYIQQLAFPTRPARSPRHTRSLTLLI